MRSCDSRHQLDRLTNNSKKPSQKNSPRPSSAKNSPNLWQANLQSTSDLPHSAIRWRISASEPFAEWKQKIHSFLMRDGMMKDRLFRQMKERCCWEKAKLRNDIWDHVSALFIEQLALALQESPSGNHLPNKPNHSPLTFGPTPGRIKMRWLHGSWWREMRGDREISPALLVLGKASGIQWKRRILPWVFNRLSITASLNNQVSNRPLVTNEVCRLKSECTGLIWLCDASLFLSINQSLGERDYGLKKEF